MCPRLHAEVYSEPLYHGENALHIAIIKKAGLEVVRTMVESPAGAALLAGRADGAFFTKEAYSDGAANNLGEYPICFAACTNQPDTLKYLIESKADLAVTTQEGNNLLHLMVLNAFDRADGSGAAPGGRVEGAYTRMYDLLLDSLGDVLRDKLRKQRNREGHTPLTLAAAKGSLAFFDHLFQKEVRAARSPRPHPRTATPAGRGRPAHRGLQRPE